MPSGNDVANQRVLLSGGSGMLGSALNRATPDLEVYAGISRRF